MSEITSIPIESGADGVAFGNVRSVVYRDTIGFVRLTAHEDPMNGARWIVRHRDHTGDSDGPAVSRSPLFYSADELNAAWAEVRRQESGRTT